MLPNHDWGRCLPHRLAAALVLTVVLTSTLMPRTVHAQGGTFHQGLRYWAVQNLDNNQVILRGRTDGDGNTFDNLILAPSTRYRAWVLTAQNLWVGHADFTTSSSGTRFTIPTIGPSPDTSPDSDGDGLNDTGEMIVGTDPHNPDTNGDGIKDGPEVQQGLDPLGGLNARTGIIATAKTPGPALDVCAVNDMAVVAEGAQGISVFNVFNGMDPTIIAQVTTPAPALRVACSDRFVPVAVGAAGLSIIDIGDPPAARITSQIPLDGSAQAVTAGGGVAYVGTDSGEVSMVDLATGIILDQTSVPGSVQDLALNGDFLYALTTDTLFAISLADGQLTVAGTAKSPASFGTNHRLSVGGGTAYAVQGGGVNTFSLANPASPTPIAVGTASGANGWVQIARNGSGLGVAVLTATGNPAARHDISLYDTSDPAKPNQLITTFVMPDNARAVSIFNGLAYVADDTAGLQVLNYLSFDTKGVPPTITLVPGFDPAKGVLEGSALRVSANVSDDVQVRNVEFYIDDKKVATIGAFPFEFRFVAPASANEPMGSFTIKARASDTGGNATTTPELTVPLVKDTTPLHLVRTSPRAFSVVVSGNIITATFSKPLNSATLTPASFQVVSAGPDEVLGTQDDSLVLGGAVSYRDIINSAILTLPAPLPPGIYRAGLSPTVTDAAGNSVGNGISWTFAVVSAGTGSASLDVTGQFLTSNAVSLFDTADPGLDSGSVLSLPISLNNQVDPNLLNGLAVGSPASIFNMAAPDTIDGMIEGLIFTILQQAP